MNTFEELVQEKVDAGLTQAQAESVVSRAFPKLKKAGAAIDPERIKEKTDAGLTHVQAESVIGREKSGVSDGPAKAGAKPAKKQSAKAKPVKAKSPAPKSEATSETKTAQA